MIVPSPFLKVDRQDIIGTLKTAASRDPDVLYAKKIELLRAVRLPKLAGVYVMVMGALLTATILGAFLGIPLLIMGWWMRRRGLHNIVTLESAYADYVKAGVA